MNTTAAKRTAKVTKATRVPSMTFGQVCHEFRFFASIADQDTAWGLNGTLDKFDHMSLSAKGCTQYEINGMLSAFLNENYEVIDDDTSDNVFDSVHRLIDYIFSKYAN